MSWGLPLDPPIPLPGGCALRTLREAADFIQRLPPAEQQHPKVQTAVHVRLQAADHGGPMIFAQMGVAAMLGRHAPPRKPRQAN